MTLMGYGLQIEIGALLLHISKIIFMAYCEIHVHLGMPD